MQSVWTWTAILITLSTLPTRPNTWEFRHSIRPGHGIGVIDLGWTPEQVRSEMWKARAVPALTTEYGRARPYFDRQANAWIETYFADPIGPGRHATVFKVFYRDHKVVQIAVSGGLYETNRGARTRMTSREVRDRHPSLRPQPVTESWGGRVRPYHSPRHGLAVTYILFSNKQESISAQDFFVLPPDAPLLIESRRHEGDVRKTDMNEVKKTMRPVP